MSNVSHLVSIRSNERNLKLIKRNKKKAEESSHDSKKDLLYRILLGLRHRIDRVDGYEIDLEILWFVFLCHWV